MSTTMQETTTLVRSLYSIFNNHNTDPAWLDKSVAHTADDFEIVDIPSGMVLRGKEGLKQFLSGWATAFPDSMVEITNMIVTENKVAVEFVGRGTHTGVLHSPAGDIAPTGKKIDVHFCDIHQIRNGIIAQQHTYYDLMTMMRQLGLA